MGGQVTGPASRRHRGPAGPAARPDHPQARGSLFDLLASLAIVHPRRVLGVAAVLGILLVPWAAGVFDKLAPGGFYAPDSSATRAEAMLDEDFPGAPPNVAVQVVAATDVDGATPSRLGRELTEQIRREPDVTGVLSYWAGETTNPLLRASDGRSALILFRLVGSEDEVQRRVDSLHDRYAHDGPGVRVRFGGAPAVMREVTEHSREDLERAELATAPLVLLVLIYAFGGVVPALLPLLVGGAAVVMSMALLRVLAEMTFISVFSINLTTALGFALAVDYSLFILRRFREEQSRGLSREDALSTSLRTAGRTVLFSGITVALSLTGTLLFPLPYLRSFAFAGVGVVLASELAALVLLPAAIMLMGDRLDRGRRGPGRRAHAGRKRAPLPAGSGWSGLARRVMARPVFFGCLAGGFMLLLAAPTAHLRLAVADDTVLPATSESHLVNDAMRGDFPVCLPCQVPVVVPGVDAREVGVAGKLADYAIRLSVVPGVAQVDTAAGSFRAGRQIGPVPANGEGFLGEHGGAWLALWPTSPDPVSAEAKDLAQQIRAVPSPFPIDVGGLAPHLLETRDEVLRSLPEALAVVVAATFVLLFLFTGSVVLPLKALVLNALNMAAVLGVLVLVFQDGHLLGLFNGVQSTGTVELTTPVLMFCVAFGLSMDYEIFLLARIREEYLRRGDNRQAVAAGLGSTGPLLTCAGLALIVVMVGVAASGISIVAMTGAGMALAVLLDITVIRAILVPAFMALAGNYNWWAPAPLRRLHARFGLREAEDEGNAPPVLTTLSAARDRNVWGVPPRRPRRAPQSGAVRTLLTRPTVPLHPRGSRQPPLPARPLPSPARPPVRSLPHVLPPLLATPPPAPPPSGLPPVVVVFPAFDAWAAPGRPAAAAPWIDGPPPRVADWIEDRSQEQAPAQWRPEPRPDECDPLAEPVAEVDHDTRQPGAGYFWIIVQ
ncbi:MMPL family transporter [Frankia sp. CNm7]|uniref:MMPL family transporter n=1 Tax=Frankia nepalensis TaxID=1836974 RepID=A0A937USA9_9ACTN|nr:MMPL family transporter [Frankia nepalensis]MBL7499558.1 MMPL family transporter [Frankia nepalensis]MBL7513186.1 MMPL family transporter [Frankia nepalensis]MBL7517587.1 MMPL family transporter [Frankia nepalensis]MBL7633674.1 MMPL family transporter [Frankia nepalensis]